jgi:hypothetical protein
VTPSINDAQHKQDSVLQKSVSSAAMLIITFGLVMLDVITLNVVLLIVVVPLHRLNLNFVNETFNCKHTSLLAKA